jgi:hypothetical protein
MKQFIFIFMLVIMLTTVSADFIGTFRVNEPMEITNYCQSGICTFTNLTSLEYPNGTIIYPNAIMTKNGQAYNYSFTPVDLGTYTFVSCGDSTIEVCDKDTFFVNFNGEDNSIATMIILLLFFMSLFACYHYLNSKMDYDKWYESILTKYESKNYVKLVLSAFGYNIIKNKIMIYYFIGFPIVIILTDIVMSYNINSLFVLFERLLLFYTIGGLVVVFSLFGQGQELIVKLIKDTTEMSWGIGGK